jgi:hypothetical protein
MGNMLEQAIVDAQELREAALKSAEAAIVEKYSTEVKSALTRILEQDMDPESFDMDSSFEDEEELSTAMEQVPMSHLGETEEEVVVVDLDDIIAAASDEPDLDAEAEPELSRDEIADEIGLDLEMEDDISPANRDDELELDTGDLMDLFKETMVIDIPQVTLDRAEEYVEEDEKEEDEKVETIRTDGMNQDDIEEYESTMAKNESLEKENKLLQKVLKTAKATLQEVNLQNARLLYANRVLTDTSLNEQQKNKIVDMVGNAKTVDETKMIFETLHKTMATAKTAGPQSLSEAVTRSSSINILSSHRPKEETSTQPAVPTYNRWATLAGMKKTD